MMSIGLDPIDSRHVKETIFGARADSSAADAADTLSRPREFKVLTPPPKLPRSHANIVSMLSGESDPVPKRGVPKEVKEVGSSKKKERPKKASFHRSHSKGKLATRLHEQLDAAELGAEMEAETEADMQADMELGAGMKADDEGAEMEVEGEGDNKANQAPSEDLLSCPLYQEAIKLGVPQEALPQSRCLGKANYTVVGPSGCRVEVHCKSKAFYLKASHDRAEFSACRTRSWKKNGGIEACWAETKQLVGWDLHPPAEASNVGDA
jgi:hypothetical protein